MLRFSHWLQSKTTGRTVVAALLLFLAFTAIVLPRQAAQAELYTGDAGSPDSSFFYTADDLYDWAEAYGEAGRRAYVRARVTFDVVWPLVYTIFLVTALTWMMGRAFPAKSVWARANLVPVLGMLFDFLENGAAALVMARYPDTTPVIASLAGFLTALKWLFVYGSFALLLFGVIAMGWRLLKGRSDTPRKP
jgi:hypothetical protein